MNKFVKLHCPIFNEHSGTLCVATQDCSKAVLEEIEKNKDYRDFFKTCDLNKPITYKDFLQYVLGDKAQIDTFWGAEK